MERQERPSLEVQVVLPSLASAALVAGLAVLEVRPSLALEALVEQPERPSLEAQVVLPSRASVALEASLVEQVVHPCLALEA